MSSHTLRILAAADIHGDSQATKKLSIRAEKERADLIVLCGDITGLIESKHLLKPFKERNQKVLILPGNWDSVATTDFLAQFYGIKNIHGYSAIYEHVGFFGAGGADIGPHPISERELSKTLEKAHAGLQGIEKKVLLTHMHPKESPSEFSGISGSQAIRDAITKFKPDLVIHGHIHEGAGMDSLIGKTRIINVGKNGTIIEI